MDSQDTKEPWYAYFFGVRGFLRLFPIAVALVFVGFVIYVIELFPTTQGLSSRLVYSLKLAVEHWEFVTILGFMLAFMVWGDAIHRAPAFRRRLPDELKNYDWWGRRVKPKDE